MYWYVKYAYALIEIMHLIEHISFTSFFNFFLLNVYDQCVSNTSNRGDFHPKVISCTYKM